MRNPTLVQFQIIPILLATAFAANAEPEMDAAPDEGTTFNLSLRFAVNLAIENNLGIEVARHGPLIAERNISLAWGAYDPTFNMDVLLSDVETAGRSNIFNLTGSTSRKSSETVSVGGLIPYLGATLSLELSDSRTNANSGFDVLSPKYESGVSVKAQIPLLRNLVWNEPWTQVEVSRVLHSSSLQDFRRAVMDVVQSTISAYWTLVAEEEQLRVANKSFQTGVALLEQTKTQYEVGVKAKVEVIQAEAGVAARELDVIRAAAAYQNSQDNLIDAVWGVRLTPSASMRVRPTDNPLDFEYHEIDPEHATELAMKHRPEVEFLELDIERRETLLRFRKNQRLPQFDLNLTYGTSGIDDQFRHSYANWNTKNGAEEYSVGGSFSIPLGNSAARHNVSKAQLELRRAKTELTRLHQQIIVEIRRGIRLLGAARKGIEASERQRIAAEEQLRAERIRLEHGESTPFDVLQKESDLVEAEVAKINALQLYRTSEADLDRAQGTILRTHNIVVGSISGLRNGFEKESFAWDKLLEPILP